MSMLVSILFTFEELSYMKTNAFAPSIIKSALSQFVSDLLAWLRCEGSIGRTEFFANNILLAILHAGVAYFVLDAQLSHRALSEQETLFMIVSSIIILGLFVYNLIRRCRDLGFHVGHVLWIFVPVVNIFISSFFALLKEKRLTIKMI